MTRIEKIIHIFLHALRHDARKIFALLPRTEELQQKRVKEPIGCSWHCDVWCFVFEYLYCVNVFFLYEGTWRKCEVGQGFNAYTRGRRKKRSKINYDCLDSELSLSAFSKIVLIKLCSHWTPHGTAVVWIGILLNQMSAEWWKLQPGNHNPCGCKKFWNLNCSVL